MWTDTVHEFLLSSFTNDRKAVEFKKKRAKNRTGRMETGPRRAAQLSDLKKDTLRVRIAHLLALQAQAQYFASHSDEKKKTGRVSIKQLIKQYRVPLLLLSFSVVLFIVSISLYLSKGTTSPILEYYAKPIEWVQNDDLENIPEGDLVSVHLHGEDALAASLDDANLVHFQEVKYYINEHRQICAKVTWLLGYHTNNPGAANPLEGSTTLVTTPMPEEAQIELFLDAISLGDAAGIQNDRVAIEGSVQSRAFWTSQAWPKLKDEGKGNEDAYRALHSRGNHGLVNLWDWTGEYDPKTKSWLAKVTLEPLKYRLTMPKSPPVQPVIDIGILVTLFGGLTTLIASCIGAWALIKAAKIGAGK